MESPQQKNNPYTHAPSVPLPPVYGGHPDLSVVGSSRWSRISESVLTQSNTCEHMRTMETTTGRNAMPANQTDGVGAEDEVLAQQALQDMGVTRREGNAMGAEAQVLARIADEANRLYGWTYPVEAFSLGNKWDFRGRRMIYAGSLYVGALDERRARLVLNREGFKTEVQV